MNPESSQNNVADAASSSRKLGLSCAECRRSKLKCDRVFPCQSCIRRGCAGICPEGTLAATKGNKVLMAHAQRLQEQVKTLTERCYQLEKDLARAKGTDLGDLGPLHDVPDSISNVSEGLGSLSIGLDGQAKYHGETSSSEYFQDLLPSDQDDFSPASSPLVNLPPDVVDLMNAFPFGFRESPYRKEMFLAYLPDYATARELAELYFVNVGWMYEPITRQDFRTSVLQVLYGPSGEKTIEAAHPHRLSLFFIVLANGCHYTNSPEKAAHGKIYEALSRASFCLESILGEATVATVQTLFLIVRLIYTADRDRNEERWLLVGLCCRLAHVIGLQRDSATWKLPAEDVQRRRRFFWELFVWEAWTSIVNGRPAALAVQHTDCQFPDDEDPQTGPDGEVETGWHAWKIRYAANILAASTYHVFSPRTPPYRALLDLDKKIRGFPLPSHLRSPTKIGDTTRSWNPDPSRAMQQYCALCTRESNLLYIHRSYFAQALKQMPDNPLQHTFAASVLATYRAASRLITSLQSLYYAHPALTSTIWYFWSGVFSSCIVLGALVIESPKCTLAQDALRGLQDAIPFYEEGSRSCRAPSTVPILEKLLHRAISAYEAGRGMQPRPSSEADQLQLELLGGNKTVIKSSSSAGSPPVTSAPQTPGSGSVADNDDGAQSPYSGGASDRGAMEMLQEYCGTIGQQAPVPYEAYGEEPAAYGGRHANTSTHGLSQQAFARTSSFTAAGAPITPDAMQVGFAHHAPQQLQMSLSRSSAADSFVGAPSASHSRQLSQSHVVPQQQQYRPEQWETSSLYNSPVVQHKAPPQQPGYHPPHMQQHPESYYASPVQAYQPLMQRPGMSHERAQEEIWREFMMGYQSSG